MARAGDRRRRNGSAPSSRRRRQAESCRHEPIASAKSFGTMCNQTGRAGTNSPQVMQIATSEAKLPAPQVELEVFGGKLNFEKLPGLWRLLYTTAEDVVRMQRMHLIESARQSTILIHNLARCLPYKASDLMSVVTFCAYSGRWRESIGCHSRRCTLAASTSASACRPLARCRTCLNSASC